MAFRLQMNLEVSDEDLDVIEHVVIDDPHRLANPDLRIGEAWCRRVHETCGAKAFDFIMEKVKRHRSAYLAAKQAAADAGVPYRNAAEIEAHRAAEEREQARQAAAADEERFNRKVAEQVAAITGRA